MISSRLAAAAFGAVLLAGAGLVATSASAAPIGAGSALATQQSGEGLLEQAQYYGPRPYYGPPRYYRRPAYRPRCYYVDRRVWNGWRWVIRPVRVCR